MEALDEPVGRDVGDNIRNVEDEESNVVLGAFEAEFGGEASNIGVANVRAVDEREEPGVVSAM